MRTTTKAKGQGTRKQPHARLRLQGEKLRALDANELSGVAGGVPRYTAYCSNAV